MNLLITGAWQEAMDYIDIIEELGHKVHFLQYEKDELPCSYDWVEGIIGNGIFLSHPIERFENLKYIQLTSVGVDRVPLDYVKKTGIYLYNAAGVYSVPMAEFAIAGVLSIYKSARYFLENQKNHKWEKKRDLMELLGKNVCILGCGSVGTECAKRFEVFGCTVYGIDTGVKEQDHFSCVFPLENMKKVLSEADIVIVTLPLTEETHHILDDEMFAVMKPGTVIVNIARGALLDTNALICALKEKFLGAVLDVFEEEPLGESPLWDMENVIITPHNSFVGNGNNRRLAETIMKNLEKN